MKNEYNNNSDLTLQICSDEENTEEESEKLFWSLKSGELVENGTMEDFESGVPDGWETTTPFSVVKVTAPGHVHSGESCVGLCDYATLSQNIDSGINPCWYYRFSFCAQLEGIHACVDAKITFLKDSKEYTGGRIKIRGEDIPNGLRQFGYYSIITSKAPVGVTGARIEFNVCAKGCQTVNIDDVSCSAQ